MTKIIVYLEDTNVFCITLFFFKLLWILFQIELFPENSHAECTKDLWEEFKE